MSSDRRIKKESNEERVCFLTKEFTRGNVGYLLKKVISFSNFQRKQSSPIYSPLSPLQIPTSKMDSRPHSQEAASTNHVPTLSTAKTIKRSSSYSDPGHEAPTEAILAKKDHEDNYQQQIKVASTALLNDDRIGTGSKAGRSLQNVLMDTEHCLRDQRRESLHKRDHK